MKLQHVRKFISTAWSLLSFFNLSLNLIHVHVHGLAALDHPSIHDCLHHYDGLCDHWGEEKNNNHEPITQANLSV